jgi:hypothetical protein
MHLPLPMNRFWRTPRQNLLHHKNALESSGFWKRMKIRLSPCLTVGFPTQQPMIAKNLSPVTYPPNGPSLLNRRWSRRGQALLPSPDLARSLPNLEHNRFRSHLHDWLPRHYPGYLALLRRSSGVVRNRTFPRRMRKMFRKLKRRVIMERRTSVGVVD